MNKIKDIFEFMLALILFIPFSVIILLTYVSMLIAYNIMRIFGVAEE